MKEIKDYDLAANKFNNGLEIKSLPLNSWDFYSMFFNEICQNSDDVFMLKNLARNNKWLYSIDFEEKLSRNRNVIVVTDPQLKIVHATHNILHMSGYLPNEIIGKKPKMFQGVATSKETTNTIRQAINNRMPFEAVLLNYRKDGSTYKCWIKGEPVLNKSGELVNFIAYEKEVA